MPQTNPVNRLPPYLRPKAPAEIHEEAERAAREARAAARATAPAMGITRLDIPFWDVFCFALKVFIAQAILGAIAGLVVYIVLKNA